MCMDVVYFRTNPVLPQLILLSYLTSKQSREVSKQKLPDPDVEQCDAAFCIRA